tara:strand:- start:174 stop:947 length:774 start_codon:yes stop_codon:yes gene_type:complete
MVYLIKGVDNYYKIGFSKSKETFKNRIKSLQTGCPVEIKIIKQIDGTLDDEANLHKKYSYFKEKGEWFEFNDFILKQICHFMEKLENLNNTKFITIKEFDYRIEDKLEYRYTKNCYKIMEENSIYCPGTLDESSFNWSELNLNDLKKLTIEDYQLLYDWILKHNEQFFKKDNKYFMFDILKSNEFDYYRKCVLNLNKIKSILENDTFKSLYNLIGAENRIWEQIIDIHGEATPYFLQDPYNKKIKSPRKEINYEPSK